MSRVHSSLALSFIIPALNESKNIGASIQSLQRTMQPLNLDYEVIVIDNGSTDDTLAIAQQLNATTFVQPDLNISGLRNFGVLQSTGHVLIFLDADVCLTEAWQQTFLATYDRLIANEKFIAGSHCAPPESDNLLLAHWFHALYQDERNTHIGSAHMIMSRSAFSEINGFNTELDTGEDFEFCIRAKKKGYNVYNDPQLKVIHHDFPLDLTSFIKREAWHGRSDYKNFTTWRESKVAIAATSFLALQCLFLFTIFYSFFLACIFFVLTLFLLLASSAFKFRNQGVKTVVINAGIFYFYYWGRVLAMFGRTNKKHAT